MALIARGRSEMGVKKKYLQHFFGAKRLSWVPGVGVAFGCDLVVACRGSARVPSDAFSAWSRAMSPAAPSMRHKLFRKKIKPPQDSLCIGPTGGIPTAKIHMSSKMELILNSGVFFFSSDPLTGEAGEVPVTFWDLIEFESFSKCFRMNFATDFRFLPNPPQDRHTNRFCLGIRDPLYFFPRGVQNAHWAASFKCI